MIDKNPWLTGAACTLHSGPVLHSREEDERRGWRLDGDRVQGFSPCGLRCLAENCAA